MENSKGFEIIEDLRQSKAYGTYMQSLGWEVIKVGEENLFLRKIGPVRIAKFQRTRPPFRIDVLDTKLKEKHVVMCKIEPLDGEAPKGFRLSNWPLLGTKTLRVDLRSNEEKIFESFKKDCRYVLRKVLSTKCEVKKNDFDGFYEIWKQSAKRKSLWIPRTTEYNRLVEAFGKNAFCITINDQAGAVVLTHKQCAFYYYAGSTTLGNKLNLPYLVVWTAMREAKKEGCQLWDFEGIFDARFPNNGWGGFSHFKKSFGGREIEFPGSFEKWRWPI